MIDLLWNLHQQSRISGLEQDAAGGQRSAAALKRDLEELQRQVDALTLTCLALGSFVEDKLGVTSAELASRIEEIDLRDGVLDGRVSPAAATCPSCARKMSARHRRCLYCGERTT